MKLNNIQKINCVSARSVIHNFKSTLMKRGEGNIVGGICFTTESYMIITNILKTMNLRKER